MQLKNMTVLVPGTVHRKDEMSDREESIRNLLSDLTKHSFSSLTIENVKKINTAHLADKSYCIGGEYDIRIIKDYKDARQEVSKYLYTELDNIKRYGSGVFVSFENKIKE